MAIPAFPDRRTQAEKDEYDRKRYEGLWLEEGRTYYYELHSGWVSGFGLYRREDWFVTINQCESPWSIVASEAFYYRRTLLSIYKLIQYIRAKRWAKAYLKRGGPPAGHWELKRYRTTGTRG